MKQDSLKLDANESIFFDTELETVRTQAYEVQYPELLIASGQIFPITMDADPADDIISYEMFDSHGVAAIISNYASDLPMVGVSGTKTSANVRTLGDAYGYTVMDVKKAAKTGKNLPNMKAMAARKGNDLTVDAIGWRGDATNGLVGVFNHPNIPTNIRTTGKAILASDATADTMYTVVANAITAMADLTNGLEIPDSIAFPVKEHATLMATRYADGTGDSVMKALKANFPNITRWMAIPLLKDVEPRPSGENGNTNIMLLWKYDATKASMEIPLPFQQLEVERVNLLYKVPCYSRIAGLITPFPLSISITEEI